MDKQIQLIRNLVNKPLTKIILIKNSANWNQLCSCLVVIEDSELAIEAYISKKFDKNIGGNYLAVYGLLQALFIQQDAVRHLCESLEMANPLKNCSKLQDIRNIRNSSIGHPTKKDRPKNQPTSYNFISQPTLTKDGFQLVSFFSNGTSKFKDISIRKLVKDQNTCLSEIFVQVIRKLKDEEKAHKENFKMEKLASCFPPTLGYELEKITESALDPRKDVTLGVISLQMVSKALQSFKEALLKRDASLDDYNIKFEYEMIEHTMAELETFFQALKGGKAPVINEKAAYIFAFFLHNQIKELEERARGIDEEYSS